LYIAKIPYIGGILSENSYKFSNKCTKPYVRWWMKTLATKVKVLKVPISPYYQINVYGEFLNESRPDIPNLFKVISDAIEDGLGINDKYFRLVDKGYSLGYTNQSLNITIIPLEE